MSVRERSSRGQCTMSIERVAVRTYPAVVLFLFKRKILKRKRKFFTPGVPPGFCQNYQDCDIFQIKKKIDTFVRLCVNFFLGPGWETVKCLKKTFVCFCLLFFVCVFALVCLVYIFCKLCLFFPCISCVCSLSEGICLNYLLSFVRCVAFFDLYSRFPT